MKGFGVIPCIIVYSRTRYSANPSPTPFMVYNVCPVISKALVGFLTRSLSRTCTTLWAFSLWLAAMIHPDKDDPSLLRLSMGQHYGMADVQVTDRYGLCRYIQRQSQSHPAHVRCATRCQAKPRKRHLPLSTLSSWKACLLDDKGS